MEFDCQKSNEEPPKRKRTTQCKTKEINSVRNGQEKIASLTIIHIEPDNKMMYMFLCGKQNGGIQFTMLASKKIISPNQSIYLFAPHTKHV